MDSNKKIKELIAANIAFYRKQNGFTQKELSTLLNVKTTTISTWERAASLPDAETLFDLCKIFRISLADIYGHDSIEDSSSYHVTKIEKCILEKYRISDDFTKELVHRALGITADASDRKMGKIS